MHPNNIFHQNKKESMVLYYLNSASFPEQKKEYETNGSFAGPKYEILVTLLAARNPNSLHVTLA